MKKEANKIKEKHGITVKKNKKVKGKDSDGNDSDSDDEDSDDEDDDKSPKSKKPTKKEIRDAKKKAKEDDKDEPVV